VSADISVEPGLDRTMLSTMAGAGGIVRGLLGLGPSKLAALAAVALSVLGLLGVFLWQGNIQNFALLYGNLELRESSQIVDALDKAHVPYELQDGGARILVPSDQVAKSRMLLARDGLPTGGSVGYELFDHADPLTMTQFQQSLNETRALEGELERSIGSISGVHGARVHLVLPRREPFEREERAAQASVILTMAPGAGLDQEGVQAILNLIAAAVPGLRPESISMVDTTGALLARAGRPAGGLAMAQTVEELRRSTEERIARTVEDLLGQTVGVGHVRAEARVEFDTQQVKETQESYNPDQQVARSERSTDEKTHASEAPTTVSVQNNLPNADAASSGAGSQTEHKEDTTNYEIGRTVRTWQQDVPQISRMSVAVMVDGDAHPGPDGKPVWHERSQQDLDRIASLVRSATGFDARRGDTLEVLSMPFVDLDGPSVSEPARPLGLERADLVHIATNALFGLVAVLALLVVVRPVVLRLASPSVDGPAGDGARGEAFGTMAVGGAVAGATPGAKGGGVAAPGAAGQADGATAHEESLLEMSNVEGQVRASSIRRTAQLADRHPEETLTILRAWMAQSEAA
jgi:flagellar M-ring protein FliF